MIACLYLDALTESERQLGCWSGSITTLMVIALSPVLIEIT